MARSRLFSKSDRTAEICQPGEAPGTEKVQRLGPVLEGLEPRVLFSADVSALPLLSADSPITLESGFPDQVLSAGLLSVEPGVRATELVAVDATLGDLEVLLADLREQQHAGRAIEIVLLEPELEGVQVVTDTLVNIENVSALHLLTHGASGGIKLGDTMLDLENVASFSAQFSEWQGSLSVDADILIYGCDVASTEDGRTLLRAIASETGADVAASIDRTGHLSLGANWQLEYRSGDIDVAEALSDAAYAAWEGELALGFTFTAPASVSVDEDSTHTFDSQQIEISHDLNAADLIRAELRVESGTLAFTNTPAITVSGEGGNIVVLEGTAADINVALQDLVYSPTAEFSASDTLEVTVENQFGLLLSNSFEGLDVTLPSSQFNGELMTGAQIVTDSERGSVLQLDGIDGHVRIDNSLGEPDNLTLGAWVNLEISNGDSYEVISIADSAVLRVVQSADGSQWILRAAYYTGSTWNPLSVALPASFGSAGWHHIAFTHQPGEQIVYLDGVEVARATAADSISYLTPEVTTIGKHAFNNGGSSYHLEGMLDNAQVFGRVLDAAEISNLVSGFDQFEQTASVAIDIMPVNDLPQISKVDAGIAYVEGDPQPVPIVNSWHITDLEIEASGTLENTTLTVERSTASGTSPDATSGANDYDSFSSASVQYDLTEGSDLVDTSGITFGSVTKNSAGTLTLTFNSLADLDMVHRLVPEIHYWNSGGWPPDAVTLHWLFNDNGIDNEGAADPVAGLTAVDAGTSAEVLTTINITPVNQAPVLTVRGASNSIFLGEGVASALITDSMLSVYDVDDSADNLVYTLVSAGNADLYYTDPSTGVAVALTDGDTFSQSDVSNGYISHQSDLSSAGIRTFTAFVEDSHGAKTDTETFTIRYTTDIPSEISSGISLNQDGGNDAFLEDTSGYHFVGGYSTLSWEFRFSDLQKNEGNGWSTLYSAADADAANDGVTESLYIQPDPNSLDAIVSWYVYPWGYLQTGVISDLFDGGMHHIAMTLDLKAGGDMTLYVDGVQEAVKPVPARYVWGFPVDQVMGGYTPWVIGQQLYGPSENPVSTADAASTATSTDLNFVAGRHFSGTLHDVRIWGDIRTLPEITADQHARYDLVNAAAPDDLLVNWQMDSRKAPVGDVQQITDATTAHTVRDINGYSWSRTQAPPSTLAVSNVLDTITPADGFISSTPTDQLMINSSEPDGALVGYVVPRDPLPDSGGYRFELVDNAGSDAFQIAPLTGEITIKNRNLLVGDSVSLTILVGGLLPTDPVHSEVIEVIVNRINDAPLLNPGVHANDPRFTEGEDAVIIDSLITVSDRELDAYGNYDGAFVTLERLDTLNQTSVDSYTSVPVVDDQFSSVSDVSTAISALTEGADLELNGTVVGSVEQNSNGLLKLVFNDRADATVVVSVLRGIAYSNSSQDPETTVTLRWLFNDGNQNDGSANDQGENLNLSQVVTTVVGIDTVNDPPVFTALNSPFTLGNEDSVVELTFADIMATATVADVDGVIDRFLVQDVITGTLVLGADPLTALPLSPSNNIISSTVSAWWTPALHSNGMQSVLELSAMDDEGAVSLTPVPSGGSGGTAILLQVMLNAVNDAPVGADNTLDLTEDKTYSLTAADFGFVDTADGNNFSGVVITGVPSSGALQLNADPLVLNDFVTAAGIAAGDLTYVGAPDEHGTPYAQLQFKVRDDGGTGYSGADTDAVSRAITFNLQSVNDAPTGQSNSVQLDEDARYIFSETDFGFSDIADNGVLTEIVISRTVGRGTLLNGSDPVLDGDTVSATQLSGGDLVFVPAADDSDSGYTDFTFKVRDDGGTLNGGVDLDAADRTLSIDVMALNDAPAGTDNTLSLNEDSVTVLAEVDFGFSDPADGDQFSEVIISKSARTGLLSNNGVALQDGDRIPVIALKAGVVTYAPAPDGFGSGHDTIEFQVVDDGGAPGSDTDPTANTLTFDVTAVSDAPDGRDSILQVVEDTRYIFSAADFGFTDRQDNHALLEIIIDDTVTDGVLLAGDAAVVDGDSIDAALIESGGLVYQPPANMNGDAFTSFTFRVRDDGGTLNGGQDTDPFNNTITLDIESINDSPSGAHKTLVLAEDSSIILTESDFGFTDDFDSNSLAEVIITHSASAGTLASNGVELVDGDGVTVAQIGAGTLTYTPAPNGFGSPYSTVGFQVVDDGGTAGGGIDTDPVTKTLTFYVTPIEDAPSGMDKTLVIDEDAPHTFSVADFGFTDNADNNALLEVVITATVAEGSLQNGGADVETGDVFTAAQLAAGAVIYTPPANNHGVGIDGFQFKVRDDGGTLRGGEDTAAVSNTITIDITSANDAPGGTDKTVSLLEDARYTLTESDFGFSDSADADNFVEVLIADTVTSGILSIDGLPVADGESIKVADINAGRVSFAPYHNESGDPYTSFQFKVMDDGGTDGAGVDTDPIGNVFTFVVTPVDDAPRGRAGDVVIVEDTPYIFAESDFGYSDPADNHALAAVFISASAEHLTLNGVPVQAGDQVPAAALASGELMYSPPADANGDAFATVKFQVIDVGNTLNGGDNTDPVTRLLSLNIQSQPDTPTASDQNVTLAEDQPHSFAGERFDFVDADGDELAGIEIVTLPEHGVLNLNDSSGVTSLSAGAQVTVAELAQLSYVADANYNAADDDFTFRVIDNSDASGADTDAIARRFSFAFVSVNDAPFGQDSTVTSVEDNRYLFSVGDFGFSDPADDDAFASVIVNTLPTSGVLAANDQKLSVGDEVAIADIIARRFSYTPDQQLNGSGVGAFTFKVVDDGGRDNGGADTAATPNTLQFDLLPANDPPMAAGGMVQTVEDTPYIFTRGDFGFSDPVENNKLRSIVVKELPLAGTLVLSGSPLSAGAMVPVDAIDEGRFAYVAVENESAEDYAHFRFVVQDDGGDEHGGLDHSLASYRMQINVLPANDAPVAVDRLVTLEEDSSYRFSSADFVIEDIEADQLKSVTITSVPEIGQLMLSGRILTAGVSVSYADIESGSLEYLPGPNSNGERVAGFDFSVQDAGGTEHGGIDRDQLDNRFDFTVLALNDTPVANDDYIVVAENAAVGVLASGLSSVIDNDTDIDNTDVLRATVLTAPAHGALVLNSDGTFRYQHDGSETHSDQIEYLLTDGQSIDRALVHIDIIPVNDPPVGEDIEGQAVLAGIPFEIPLSQTLFTDADPGDSLTMTATLADGSPWPEWLTFDPQQLTLSGLTADSETLIISIHATDQSGAVATSTVSVTIEPQIAALFAEATDAEISVPTDEPSQAPAAVATRAIIVGNADGSASGRLAETTFTQSEVPPSAPLLDYNHADVKVAPYKIVDFEDRVVKATRSISVSTLTGQSDHNIDINVVSRQSQLLDRNTGFTAASGGLSEQLDERRKEMQTPGLSDPTVVASAVGVTGGLSVGYILWLVRGGMLLSSVLTALPAWRMIDPLPVLGELSADDDDSDESLNDLVERDPEPAADGKDPGYRDAQVSVQ